ncbi:MAG: tetratricopeptide repeat protein [Verrucomicrobiota bacterium]|jgi:predicted negative regulator of RcsB-dependent stress response
MQSQDASTAFLLKLWPWIEANKNRVIVGSGIVLVAIFLYYFFSWQREQHEIAAGEALTQVTLSLPANANAGQLAGAYLKIAGEYPGTLSGRRAWLQGAAALFEAGKFADAQAQFQKFLDAHPDGDFSASAALGVAASLEALGKWDLASIAYQRVINGFSDAVAANAAKLALGGIDEQQGKFGDALNLYESIAQLSPGSLLAQEAGMHALELRTKSASATPAAGKPWP